MPGTRHVTDLLKAWVQGDESAHEQLIPLVYRELHQLAHRSRLRNPASDTLQTTALVHEAYERLIDIESVDWTDRNHFFAVSAQLMRRILVDAARARKTAKRGGPQARVQTLDLDGVPGPDSERGDELIALDGALDELARVDPRRSQVVELRVFSGLSVEETAQIVGVSSVTVMRDWRLAKAWLLKQLST